MGEKQCRKCREPDENARWKQEEMQDEIYNVMEMHRENEEKTSAEREISGRPGRSGGKE